MLSQGATMMEVACAAIWGDGDMWVCAVSEGHIWVYGLTVTSSVLMFMARATTKIQADVHDCSCIRGPYLHP